MFALLLLLFALLSVFSLYYLVLCNEDPKKCDKKLKNKPKKFNVIDPNTPSQNFLLSDDNGNISRMNFGTTSLNSNIAVNGRISADGVISTGNISSVGMSSTGNISSTGDIISNNGSGYAVLRGGSPSSNNLAGHVNFYKKDNSRKGYIGWGAGGGDNNYIEMNSENASGYMITPSSKLFCIGDQCLSNDDIRRLKTFLTNLQTISTTFSYLKQRGGKNDGNATMNGIGGNSDSKWAACLSDFFQDLQSLFNI